MDKLKINVTQEHINKGKVNSANSCPVALAIRETNNHSYIWVEPNNISITTYDLPIYYSVPANVKEFIQNFDKHNPVEPFEFELIPEEVWDFIGIKLC